MTADSTSPQKKIYFISDFHLGVPSHAESLIREKKIVDFLNSIKEDAAEIFLLGDMFDFWYEYKKVVPRGFVRLLGTLAQITDSGIPVHFFVGNHDMWMNNYLQEELNIKVYYEPQVFIRNNKKLYIGHGDGLGPGDHGYKFIKKVFRNPICQWLFGFLHPSIGIGIANYFSQKSKDKAAVSEAPGFYGEDKEWLIIYSKEMLATEHYDYFIFGHRHLPIDFPLPQNSRYINTGDWIKHFTYAVMDGDKMELKEY